MKQSETKMNRYAIYWIYPDGTKQYHVQGSPACSGDQFEFAILYSSLQHAEKATKVWKFRTMMEALKAQGSQFFIEKVKIEVLDKISI